MCGSQDREVQHVVLRDGRRLGYAAYGAESGPTIVSFHGGLSCRLDAAVYDAAARSLGLRILAPDRPGIGLSDPAPERCLSDWPRDVEQLVDQLGVDRFGVVGWSLGGQYALATCAAMSSRVRRAALVGSAIPLELARTRRGLMPADRLLLVMAHHQPRATRLLLEQTIGRARPRMLRRVVGIALGRRDGAALRRWTDPDLARRFVAEAFLQGAAGVVRDVQLWRAPWGLELEDIATPVAVWRGTDDHLTPASYTHHLIDRLPHSTEHTIDGQGHLSILLEHATEILSSATGGPSPPRA